MRIFNTDSNLNNEDGRAIPVLFTGSAISFLPTVSASINFSEWQWHEEMVNGRRTRIITDKKNSDFDLFAIGAA